MTDRHPHPNSELSHAERTALKRKLNQLVHRTGMLAALEVKNESGAKPVIFALDDDTIGAVIEQANWSGGEANVIIHMREKGEIAVLDLHRNTSLTPTYAKVTTDLLKLHESSHIGMLVHAARLSRLPLELKFEGSPASDVKHLESILSDELAAA